MKLSNKKRPEMMVLMVAGGSTSTVPSVSLARYTPWRATA
jgi:hypothetical protein